MASAILKAIPKDVLDFVLDEQTRVKKERGIKSYGFASTVYMIIRDYQRCREGEIKPKKA